MLFRIIAFSVRDNYSRAIKTRLLGYSSTFNSFRNTLVNNTKSNLANKNVYKALNFSCGTAFLFCLKNNYVLCDNKTRLVGYQNISVKKVAFDWTKFWKYLRPHILYFIAAIIGALIVAILNIQIPLVVGNVINIVSKYSRENDSTSFLHEIKLPGLKILGMYSLQSLSTFFYIYMLSNLGEKIAFDIRTDLFQTILKQDISFFDKHRTGEIVNRLTSDVQDFKSSFKQTISGGLRAAAQIVGCTVSLVVISPQMTLVTLLCVPTIIGIGTVVGSILRLISLRAQIQGEKTTAVADEAIANIRTVRAFAMEEQERELFNGEAELAMKLNQELGFGIGWFQAGANMFLNSMVLATIYMGGYLLSTEQLSPGDLMAYLMATQTIQRSLAQISLLFGSVVRGMAAGTRVFEYIKMEPSVKLRGGKMIPEHLLKGSIEFKNVSFAYPTRPEQVVLKNFNLKVPSGKIVAIVGASGSGKSTSVALLERFYNVIEGSITLDDHDIRDLDPSWLRQSMGLISQEPVLFGTTILENIRYGKPDASDQEVKEAARLANAHDFITGFPKGYQTLVGERGATLSGGQKQRIAIARALLKNPKILLLDEATSALDTESEKIVQNALESAQKGRTVIVIAHRLSTIRNADLIVVLHRGNVVEMGTHESLQKLRGHYWSLTYQQREIGRAHV